jgi:hypothetical protein
MFRGLVPIVGVFLLAASTGFGAEKEAVSALVKQLKDKDVAVRLKAAQSLLKLGPAAREAIPALEEAAKDSDEEVAAMAAKGLKTLKVVEKEELAALIAQLKDKDATVRHEAAKTLSHLGLAAKEALPALVEAAKDKDEDVAAMATKALEAIREGELSERVKLWDESTRNVATIKDKQTLADAKPKLMEIADRMRKLEEEAQKQRDSGIPRPKLSKAQREMLIEATNKFRGEYVRVTKIEGGTEVLDEFLVRCAPTPPKE